MRLSPSMLTTREFSNVTRAVAGGLSIATLAFAPDCSEATAPSA